MGTEAMQCDLREPMLDPQFSVPSELTDALEVVPLLKRKPKRVPSVFPRKVDFSRPVDLMLDRLVAADGVCESVLYGNPHLLLPTTSFKLTWDQLLDQQHRFQALAVALDAQRAVALVRRANDLGVFMLLPTTSSRNHPTSMLLKVCSTFFFKKKKKKKERKEKGKAEQSRANQTKPRK